MKPLIDYLRAMLPNLNELQEKHIEHLVGDMLNEAKLDAHDKGFWEGHKAGFKQGELQGRMTGKSMSDEELEDFYKEREK